MWMFVHQFGTAWTIWKGYCLLILILIKKKRKEKNSWIVETVLDDIFWVYVLAGIRLLM